MSDQPEAAAQKIIELACRGPLRLDDVIAEIAPLVKERDDARAERDEAVAGIPATLIPLSDEFQFYNGGQQCDALIGHCACGAFHTVFDIQKRFAKLATSQQQALEAYIAKLDSTQQARDAALSFTEECRKEWADTAIALRASLATAQARVARLETALRDIRQKAKTNNAHSLCLAIVHMVDEALSDPAPNPRIALAQSRGYMVRPSGASSVRTMASRDGITWTDLATIDLEPRQLTKDELAVPDPSRTIADIARTQFDRADQ